MTRMPPLPRRQPPPPAYRQPAYSQGAYGPDPYGQNQGRYRKTGPDPIAILAGVLGGLAALFFVLVLVFWNLKAGTENRLVAKRTENNKLKEENHSLEKSNGRARQELELTGPEGYSLAGHAGNQPREGAEYWKNKYEEMAKLRDDWAMRAKYWDDQMSARRREWEEANASISVPKDSIDCDAADAEGRPMVAFTVQNKYHKRLTNLAGRLRFYQGGKQVAEKHFEVDAVDAKSTRQMRVYVPPAITGPFQVAGSIKATGF